MNVHSTVNKHNQKISDIIFHVLCNPLQNVSNEPQKKHGGTKNNSTMKKWLKNLISFSHAHIYPHALYFT